MNGGQTLSLAAVAFASAREAERRVAGVAVAGRIVYELAQAGFTVAWLKIPAAEAIDAAAMADVHRLAGSMAVRIGEPPAGEAVATVTSAIDLSAPGASMEVLRATGKASDGPVSRWLNRPVSRRLSVLLLRLPWFRPIHATAGTVLLALTMFVALVAGGVSGLIAGGLLFQAASVFDGVDGEVARATFRTSRFGATLDSLVDAATNALFILGLTLNLAQTGHDRAVVLGGWGLALFFVGQGVIGWRNARAGAPVGFDLLKHEYRARVPAGAGARAMEFLTIVSSRDFFALLFAVLILFGVPMAVLYIFAGAATIWIMFVAASLLAPVEPGLVPDRG